jgi:DNA-binding transcriptional ArsR family regulator
MRASVSGGFRFTDSNTRSPQDLYTHQWGPRVGFAYQLFPKTVIRSAYGIFWLPGAIMETTGDSRAPAFSINTPMVTSVDGNLTPFNTLDNPYPLPDGITNPPGASQGLLTLLGQDAAANRRYYHSGYTQQWNFDIQQDLGRSMLLEVTYSGSAGVGLPAGWATQINQIPDQYLSLGSALLQQIPNPFFGLVSTGNLAQKTIPRGQLLRPFPQFQSLFGEADAVGHSSFHSFAAQFKKRFAHGLVGVSYTVSKALGNTETRSDFLDGVTTNADGFEDIYNRRLNRSLMAYDVPQRIVVNYSLELPFGKGQRFLNQGGILNRVAGGWEVNGIYTAQSGIPVALINQTNTVGNYSNVTDVYGTANANTRPNNNGTSARLDGAPRPGMLRLARARCGANRRPAETARSVPMPATDTNVMVPSRGLPSRPLIAGPSAWIGADMRGREAEWSYRLAPPQVAEIDAAAAAVRARGLDIAEISRADFPLPTLGPVLDRLRADNGQTLNELCARLDMTRQAVSKHLAILEEANLVATVWRGRQKLHYLNPVPIHEIGERWIGKFERGRLQALSDMKKALEEGTGE